jgi:NADH-quinone oxidoreductase subunit G
MRVWFLKETKTIDVNCGTGANITVSARENVIYRITPRQNDAVNSCWLPDSHRLNFKYVSDEGRLKAPMVKGETVEWRTAIAIAAEMLKAHASDKIGLIASARATNEELYLVRRLIAALGIDKQHDVVPRVGEPDGLLISADRNPNTTGAKLLNITTSRPGYRLK